MTSSTSSDEETWGLKHVELEMEEKQQYDEFTDSFEVEFATQKLTPEEKKVLTRTIESVQPGNITFGLNVDKTTSKIVPLDVLLKLQDVTARTPSDLNINLLDRQGKIISTIVYKQCVFEVIFSDLLNLSTLPGSSFGVHYQKKAHVHFSYEQITYNQKEIRA